MRKIIHSIRIIKEKRQQFQIKINLGVKVKTILNGFVLLIFISVITLSEVNTRLVQVSNTYDYPTPGRGTLVIDVEAISDAGAVDINSFQDAFFLDATFQAQNPDVTFSDELFSSSYYTTTEDYTSGGTHAGRVRYIYTFDSGTRGTIGTDYTKIVRVTIEYDMTDNNGSISWYDGNPQYFVTDEGDQKITGVEEPIPTELQSIPLPIELTTFTVMQKGEGVVSLTWETATEVNNYGFEIERAVIQHQSSSGGNEINDEEKYWEKIGFVKGVGNSNSPKKYNYTDKNLSGGSYFVYRLKQIDIDGTFEYSSEVEIEVLPTKYELNQNYPNPFNPMTTIKFSLPERGKVQLEIYNMIGERIAILINKEMEAGYHSINFDASNLSSGVYFYRINTKNFNKVRKMLLVK